ncbi:MAG: hypothetical protein AAF548_13065 [Actinomycetota bacterium]
MPFSTSTHPAGPDVLRLDLHQARRLRWTMAWAAVELRNDAISLERLLDDASSTLGRDRRATGDVVRAASSAIERLGDDLGARLHAVDVARAQVERVDELTAAILEHHPRDDARSKLAAERFALVRELVGDRRTAVRILIALAAGHSMADALALVRDEMVRDARIAAVMAERSLSQDEAASLLDTLDARVADLVAGGHPVDDSRWVVALAESFDLDLDVVQARARRLDVGLVDAAGAVLTATGLGVSLEAYDALDGLAVHFDRFDDARRRGGDGRVSVEDLAYIVAEHCRFTDAEVLAATALLAHPDLVARLDTANDNDDIFGDHPDASAVGFGSLRGGDGVIGDVDLRAFMVKAQLHTILGPYADRIDAGDDPTGVADGYRSEADIRAFLASGDELPASVRAAADTMLEAGWFDESWWQEHKGELAAGAALLAGGVVVLASGGTASFGIVALAGRAGGGAAGATTLAINAGTDDEMGEDLVRNTLIGVMIGGGVGGVGQGVRAAASGGSTLARVGGVAGAASGGTDVVMYGGVDLLLSDDDEATVRDWVGPVSTAATAADVVLGRLRVDTATP